jgi:hypothetical protein
MQNVMCAIETASIEPADEHPEEQQQADAHDDLWRDHRQQQGPMANLAGRGRSAGPSSAEDGRDETATSDLEGHDQRAIRSGCRTGADTSAASARPAVGASVERNRIRTRSAEQEHADREA